MHPGHVILYITLLLSSFLIGGFKLGSVVFSFLKVTIGCIGAPDFFNCFIKLSVTLPRYYIAKVDLGSWFSLDSGFLGASPSFSFRMICSIVNLIMSS